MATPPSAGNPVIVGPYQRIVAVNWPSGEAVIVSATLNWWGVSQGLISCSGDTDPGLPTYLKFYSPVFYATSFKLWPNKVDYVAGRTDGITSINGELPADSGFTYSGMPEPIEHVAGQWTKIALSLDFEGTALSDFRLQFLEAGPSALSADFVLYSPNTDGTQWCDSGNTWQDADSRFWTGSEVDLTYAFEAFRETLDFSGLSVTRTSDGKSFNASAIELVGNNTVNITMTPA